MTGPPRISDRDALARSPAHDLALACVGAGIEAAQPDRVVATQLELVGDVLCIDDSSEEGGEGGEGEECEEGEEADETDERGTVATYDLGSYEELLVVGGGKASGRLVAALEDLLGDRIDRGAVVVPDPDDAPPSMRSPDGVKRLVGSHPVPDEDSVAGARRVLELVRAADENTLVLAAITGGGSALLAAPAEGIALGDLQAVTERLLDSGATIHEVNAVRKHCSAIKGGQLARAAMPARVAGLVMSDVVGDDLGVIASGPTAPDPTTYGDALGVLDRYDVTAPTAVRDRLERGHAGEHTETPGPGDPIFDRVRNHLLATAHTALDAAGALASERGYNRLVLSARVRGEAREAALTHVAVAEEILDTGEPVAPPAVVLSGGETTVTVRGDGIGGPNQEFALRAALEVPDGAVLAAVDTDGRDGSTDAAGALVDSTTVDAGETPDARDALGANDAYPFLDERASLVRTGPTGTNVNDLRVLVVED